MHRKIFLPIILTLSLASPFVYADISKDDNQTTATFKTQDGKEVRCIINPEDVHVVKGLEQGEKLQLCDFEDGSCS